MKRSWFRILWGSLLVLAGALFMAQNLNFIPSAWVIIWGLFFGIAGAGFLYAFSTDRSQWWTLIPGLALFGLMLLIIGDTFLPRFTNEVGGSIFLGAVGLGFWAVYLVKREAWWAVIPAGILTTLAIVVGVDPFVHDNGWLFLVGMGLTFAMVGILPTPSERMTWAFIPAGIFLVLGLFTSEDQLPFFNYVWPVILIGFGGYLVLRNIRN